MQDATPPDTATAMSSRPLLARPGLKSRIALGSALMLALGAWLTPPAAQTSLSPSQERAAPLLEEQVQLRESTRMFTGVQDVAARVRAYTVAIPPIIQPVATTAADFSSPEQPSLQSPGFGVFVGERHVLAHSAALDGRSEVPLLTTDGRADARLVAYEASTGLVLLETGLAARPAVTLASQPLVPGMLAVAVGGGPGSEVAVPMFITRAGGGRYTVGAMDARAVSAGMPVFTITGELFAIAAPDADTIRAFPAREATERLVARATSGEPRSSLGIRLQALTGQLARVFGDRGVLVSEVIAGGPADVAGVRVGDVLLSIDDVDVDSLDIATAALQSRAVAMPSRVRVVREGRIRDVEVTPAQAYTVAFLARSARSDAGSAEARALFTPAQLATAQLPPSARILTINGRVVTSRAQAQRELRTARGAGVPVLALWNQEPFFVALESAR